MKARSQEGGFSLRLLHWARAGSIWTAGRGHSALRLGPLGQLAGVIADATPYSHFVAGIPAGSDPRTRMPQFCTCAEVIASFPCLIMAASCYSERGLCQAGS